MMGAARAAALHAVLLSVAAAAEAQITLAATSDGERAREIERVARRLAAADSFSGVVLVAKDDSVLYVGAFGSADKARNLAIRPDTRFALASITKTFVTVAIARLVEEGKLSWDDSLGKLIPEFPMAQARSIRIKHLLTHTSGLRELDSVPRRPRSLDHYVRFVVLAQQDSLLYPPGTRSAYNNGNYVLLGKIIEVTSGRPFYEYIREEIIQPVGMNSTDFDRPGTIPQRLARAYDRGATNNASRAAEDAPSDKPTTDYPEPYTGAHSTAHDLFRFARALSSGRIVRKETAHLLFSPKPEEGNWGYGWDILDEKRGIVGHGGSYAGMSNSLDMFTRSGYTVVILSNYTRGRSPLRDTVRSILP
jgi:CubicO group peptidase (beta-lactamase class C family)